MRGRRYAGCGDGPQPLRSRITLTRSAFAVSLMFNSCSIVLLELCGGAGEKICTVWSYPHRLCTNKEAGGAFHMRCKISLTSAMHHQPQLG